MSSNIYSIYIIRNLITNMVYVGFTINIKRRINQHIWSAFERNSFYPLHKAMREYGIKNFELEIIYQSFDGENCLRVWEPYFIRKYNTHYISGYGYNMTLGGEGIIGLIFTENHRKNLSIARKKRITTKETIEKKSRAVSGSKNPMYGRKFSKESIQKRTETRKRNIEKKLNYINPN